MSWVNSGSDDANAAFSTDGHWLFFASPRPGGSGAVDLYQSELNSTSNDNRPNLRPDGSEIFFYSTRPGVGGSDLWSATRATTDATWSTPVNRGATVNTSASEAHSYLSADGTTLVLDSTRPGGFGDRRHRR